MYECIYIGCDTVRSSSILFLLRIVFPIELNVYCILNILERYEDGFFIESLLYYCERLFILLFIEQQPSRLLWIYML